MDVTFRIAVDSDIEALVAFMRQLYEHDHTYFDEVSCRKTLPLILANEHFGKVWMIESDNRAIGYVVVTFGFSIEYHGRNAILDEIFVSEGYRGQGIGKQAINLAVEACRSLGIDAIHLVVEHENLNAQAVYRNLGFKTDTRYLMTKWIGESAAE
jgi:ribosomal protein S18 acetylase RimI-like enzyme